MGEASVMSSNDPGRWRAVLDIAVSIVLITSAITLVWLYRSAAAAPPGSDSARPVTPPSEPVSIAGSVRQGSSNAQVVLIEFSEFECPFCRQFAQTSSPEIERDFVATGRVELAFWHFPLSIHSTALGAAVAADCAGHQGQFWPMHDALFSGDAKPDDAHIQLAAKHLRLDLARLGACSTEEAKAAVRVRAGAAARLGVSGTPTFFIGYRLPDGRVKVTDGFSGALPAQQFRIRLDAALKQRGWQMWLSWSPYLGAAAALLMGVPAVLVYRKRRLR